MLLQIVSDLHLEFRPDDLDFIIPTAPILCLLGDICVIGTDEDFNTYKKFIDTVYSKFKLIIHVAGNHEYYNATQRGKDNSCTLHKINDRLKRFSKTKKKLKFLDNKVLKIKENKKTYYLMGTTLWSYIDPANYSSIQKVMNDYQYIHVEDPDNPSELKTRKFKVTDMQVLHKKSIAFIKRSLISAKKERAICILLTHHKPFREKTNILSQAYESDLKPILHSPIKLIAYGHTHKAFDDYVNKIHTVSNPRGYPGQKTKFKPDFAVKV